MKKHIQILKELQTESGLFIAAPSNTTGYAKAWMRDNVYSALGLEATNAFEAVKVYHKLLDILIKHEGKIDWAIMQKPTHAYQYIHARFHPITLDEFWEEWGNKQNDAIGAFLFKVADLLNKGLPVIRNHKDKEIVEKLVKYLASIEYWHDKDNGMWEENEEVHASSVGACVAGLKNISKYVYVPEYLIEKGLETLNKLLPKESATKDVDLALLSLIYPYDIVSKEIAKQIIKNVKKKLERKRGIIRYANDKYYNKNGEAEWTMGFPWLAIIYRQLGDLEQYKEYMKKTVEIMNKKNELPELYFANSKEHNDNSPLGWAQSLYIVAAL